MTVTDNIGHDNEVNNHLGIHCGQRSMWHERVMLRPVNLNPLLALRYLSERWFVWKEFAIRRPL